MRWLKFVVVMLLLVGTGCSGGGPPSKPPTIEASGKILSPSGSPLGGGLLILRPVEGLYGASAPIQANGSFDLVDQEGKKSVVPGKYFVYVRVNADQKAILAQVPAKYHNTEDGNSDVQVDIQKTQSDLVIRLKK